MQKRLSPEVQPDPIVRGAASRYTGLLAPKFGQRFQPDFTPARQSRSDEVQIMLCGDIAPRAPRRRRGVGNAQITGEVSRRRPYVKNGFHAAILCALRSHVNAFCVTLSCMRE